MPFLFIFAGWIILVAIFTIVSASRAAAKRRPPQSDDGHTVKASQDLTCETKYGHNHDSRNAAKRYIVHEDPPEGYVILNGIKRKISDCRNL